MRAPSRRYQLDQALEAFHFAFRSLVAQPDEILGRHGLGRVHHRILYFISAYAPLSVGVLTSFLRVSRQALHGPLRRLILEGWVEKVRDGEDARQQVLRLTRKGAALEETITGLQRRHLDGVFRKTGPVAEKAWRRVMAGVAGDRSGGAPLGGFR